MIVLEKKIKHQSYKRDIKVQFAREFGMVPDNRLLATFLEELLFQIEKFVFVQFNEISE